MFQSLSSVVKFASEQTDAVCKGVEATGGSCDAGVGLTGNFQDIANTLIFVVGAIAVIMIIIGGLRYVLSGGDSASIKGAKDTIMYALVGVVVAVLAYALVSFVISRFS